MKKNYTLKVKPRRFIYHVAHSNTRQSILKKGLVGCPQEINGFRNAIFAHNSVMPNYSWYPFCFDAIFNWALDSPLFESACRSNTFCINVSSMMFSASDIERANSTVVGHTGKDNLNPKTERGDKVVGSADEAAATAAADEEDTEGKETGAAGVESAGEAAVAEG